MTHTVKEPRSFLVITGKRRQSNYAGEAVSVGGAALPSAGFGVGGSADLGVSPSGGLEAAVSAGAGMSVSGGLVISFKAK